MNEFTKEELEKIWESLECDDTGFYVGEALINKIKSMAEKYCEHELEICKTPFFDTIICSKCRRVMDGE